MPLPVDLRMGDVLTLKKPHACGGDTWTVVRLGMDIGITCQQCARRVLLPRSQLERRIRRRQPTLPPPGSA
jgi:hypothetical protein